MKKLLLLFSANILAICSLTAQLSTHERPYSFSHNVTQQRMNSEVIMPPIPSISELTSEDSSDNLKGRPPRFGYLIKTNLNTYNSGTWDTLSDGSKLWRMTISSKGAHSINLLYDKFWLPDSSKFYIYNSTSSAYLGAFTQRNNKGTKTNIQGFATGLVYGDKITLEYYQPAFVKDTPVISIAYVVHGYKYIKFNSNVSPPGGGFGESSSCEININCPQGNDYQNEKHAVALIVVGGNRYCTGSLINTTAANASPYFLTACHCLSGWANPTPLDAVSNPNANYWSFYWDYESPTCDNPTSDITTAFSTSGATVVANYPQTDFALLKLTEDPKNVSCFTPYYLGWSRNSSDDHSGGIADIHHPEGDIKKISFANSAVNVPSTINWDGGVTTPANTHWAADFYIGGIEPGSSGSPLLNSSHLVIGQLHGGNGTCAPVTKYFGRFDKSWNGDGSTPQRRLKDWLDPNGSNPTTLAGQALLPSYAISGPTSICYNSTGTYTVSNLPAGATVNWSVSPSINSSISGNAITLIPGQVNPSSVTLTANVVTSSCLSGFSRTMNIAVASNSNTVSMNGLDEDVYLQGDVINLNVTPTLFDAGYQWYLNGHLISTSSNCTINENTQGILCGRNIIEVDVLSVCGSTTATDQEHFSYLCQNFSISPNPANTILTIQPVNKNTANMSQANPAVAVSISQVNIYDKAGKLQLSQPFNASKLVQLNVGKLTNGIYFVEIVTTDGNKEKQKLLIQR